MLKNSWKLILASLAAVILSLYLTNQYYISTYPLGGIHLKEPPEKILEKGRAILQEYQLNPDDYNEVLNFDQNGQIIRGLQEEAGLEQGNQYLRESIPGYYWRMNYRLKEDEESPAGTVESVYKEISLRFDTDGNLFELWTDIPDTMPMPQFEMSEAKRHVRQFIEKYTSFNRLTDTLELNPAETEENFKRQSNVVLGSRRTDFDFSWQEPLPEADRKVEISVAVAGSVISSIKIEYPVRKSDERWTSVAKPVTVVLLMLVIMVLVIYLIYKKSRSYEIQFSMAFKLSVLLVLIVLLEQVIQMQVFSEWDQVFSLLVLPLLMGGTFVVLFATGESVCREIRPDALIPFDLIIKGHFLHSRIGGGLLKGLLAGSLLFAGYLLSIRLLDAVVPVTNTITGDSNLRILIFDAPSISVLVHVLWVSIYVLAVFVILLPSYLQLSLGRKWLTILATAVIYAIINGNLIQPFFAGLLIQTIVFAVMVWLFLRFDVLISMVALISFSLLEYLPVIWSADYGGMSSTYIMLGVPVIFAVYSLLTRDSISDLTEIQPVLSRLISERQRMKQELEIAREVQAGLFPRSQPVVPGLDIAADCIPAQEVGGDYYDFIVNENNSQLTLAIGDVSGKGTKAAFYMTLVKGFLKALARQSMSPVTLLRELNSLFFENTRNDAFVSMIYAVFNMEERRVIMARSGHNPVIHYRAKEGSIETIRSEGLALGLEKGEIFNRLIEEKSISLSHGDLFVFYTDGLTEARNKLNHEYGEDRLYQVVMENKDLSAKKLLDKIYQNVHKFDRGAPQYDDKTLVVVKVEDE